MNILNTQYEFIRSSRAVMLNFIENEVGEHYNVAVTEFNSKDIRYFLLHINNTYKYWIGNFAMKKDLPYVDYGSPVTMPRVRRLFEETDNLITEFLQLFPQLDQPVTNDVNTGGLLTTTPLQSFTHAITHEFHHKGQIMTMCRMLGHLPPDTDVIRT